MTIGLDLEWKPAPPDVRVFVVGDVRDVIYSRAGRLMTLPGITHGFGALSPGGPDLSGEGMVWHGRTGGTPPLGKPEVVTGALEGFSTPFFLGWLGEPAAQGSFTAGGNTLHQLYERLFEEIPAAYSPDETSLLLLELLGTAHAGHIHDRALKKPVHEGDTLITALPSEYFNFHIVQADLARPLALAVVGAGYRPGGDSPALRQFEQKVFYEPPRLKDAPAMRTGPGEIKTHSHMMAWRDEHDQAASPDYILHLDEWSQIAEGTLRLFVVSPERIEFVSV